MKMKHLLALSAMLFLMLLALVLVAMPAPAHANDYDVSPYTGAIYPRSSSQRYDPPPVYIPPRHVWPRGCPLDGPGAWDCSKPHDRRRYK